VAAAEGGGSCLATQREEDRLIGAGREMDPIPYDAAPPSAPLLGKESKVQADEDVPSGGRGTENKSEFQETLEELQSWDVPARSGGVVGAATAIYYLTSGANGYSVASLACYMLVVRLGLVKLARKFMSRLEKKDSNKKSPMKSLLERLVTMIESTLVIPQPSTVSKIISGIAGYLETKFAKSYEMLTKATEPTEAGSKAFKVTMAHLGGGIVALWAFSFWTLSYLFVLYQILWPGIYSRHKEKKSTMP